MYPGLLTSQMLLWLGTQWIETSWKQGNFRILLNCRIVQYKWPWAASTPASCSVRSAWNWTSLLRVCPVRFWKPSSYEGFITALGLCSSALSSSEGKKDFLVRNSLSQFGFCPIPHLQSPPLRHPKAAAASRPNTPNFLPFCLIPWWGSVRGGVCWIQLALPSMASPQELLFYQDFYSDSPCQKQRSRTLYFHWGFFGIVKVLAWIFCEVFCLFGSFCLGFLGIFFWLVVDLF